MAERDPLDRLSKIWEQQREALEDSISRLQASGRKVADAVSDAVRRVSQGDDLRSSLGRLEEHQREVLSKLADAQRDAFERFLEVSSHATEAVWKGLTSALSDITGRVRGAESSPETSPERVAGITAPAPGAAPEGTARTAPTKSKAKPAQAKPAQAKPPTKVASDEQPTTLAGGKMPAKKPAAKKTPGTKAAPRKPASGGARPKKLR